MFPAWQVAGKWCDWTHYRVMSIALSWRRGEECGGTERRRRPTILCAELGRVHVTPTHAPDDPINGKIIDTEAQPVCCVYTRTTLLVKRSHSWGATDTKVYLSLSLCLHQLHCCMPGSGIIGAGTRKCGEGRGAIVIVPRSRSPSAPTISESF